MCTFSLMKMKPFVLSTSEHIMYYHAYLHHMMSLTQLPIHEKKQCTSITAIMQRRVHIDVHHRVLASILLYLLSAIDDIYKITVDSLN